MALENFTTYTEVDANNKLTVIANRATGLNVDRNEDVYLYKDFGADYFDALDIDFELYLDDASITGGFAGPAIANTVGSIASLDSTDIAVAIQEIDGPAYLLRLIRGSFVAYDDYSCSADTLYYCTLKRAAGSDTVTLEIYSDSARTSLLDTLSVAGYGTTTKYRYCYGFINYNDTRSNRDFDGFVQNMEIISIIIGGYSFIF